MAAAWWNCAPVLLDKALKAPPGPFDVRRYRFACGDLELDSDDGPLNRRFGEIYPEGLVESRGGCDSSVRVRCTVRGLDDPKVSAIEFEDPEELDSAAFCRALFPDRGYIPGPGAADGWQTISPSERPSDPVIAMKGNHALVDRDQVWQPFIANLAVNRVLRLQRNVLFFHAASVVVSGRGLLVVGPKGSGKTTTALTLASRGHGFLGDEIAAVRAEDRKMLPFRRAASIRAGMRAARVAQRLDDGAFPAETFPDGSARVLANVADLFPDAVAASARLAGVFFLRRFVEQPAAARFDFGLEHFSLLTPLASSMWGMHAGSRVVRISRMMKEVSCFHLDPGSPDATAELLERIAEELPN